MPRTVELRLTIDADDQLDELERALLKARATELSEVRRRNVRLTALYGDPTTREVMDDEGRRATVRHEMLDRLIDALRGAALDREATPSAPPGGDPA